MIQKSVRIQGIDFHHIDTLALDHLEFQNHLIFPVPRIDFLIENFTQIHLHRVHDTLNFLKTKWL